MEQKPYLELVDACFARVETWLEDFDPDELDYETTDGVITFVFGDGMRFVLNRQTPASQVWFAAGARAWHYDWDDEHGEWRDDRDGHELYGNVSRCVAEKLGRDVAAPG